MILVDVITCLFGIATITLFKSKKVETKSKMNIKNIYLDLVEAYNWLKKQKGLLSLVLILGICNFLWGFTQVLLPPMILSFTDATGLGLVESSIGLAFLLALSSHFDYQTGFKETLKLQFIAVSWED